MTCEIAKEAWDKLKKKFHGSDKIRKIQVINLRREFEVLRMEMRKLSNNILIGL